MIKRTFTRLFTWRTHVLKDKHELVKNLLFAAFFVAWFVYFYFLWRDMIVYDGQSVRIGWIGVWGDWAMHFTQGSAFAYRSLWITEHPLLLGAPYSYPFAVNWISGLLIRWGVSFFSAFVIPSFLYCIAFVFMLMLFYRVIFKSRLISLLATSIFLLNGGLGFAWYIQEVIKNPTWEGVFRSPTEFTHMTKVGIEWISVITSMMVPQRAFVFGFPIALCVALLIYSQFQKLRKDWNIVLFGITGFLYGSLTILHTHSFLALGIVFAWWAVFSIVRKEPQKRSVVRAILCWFVFACTSLLVACPILFFFDRSTIASTTLGNFIKWFPGWFVNPRGDHAGMGWSWWWLLNWGITLPVGVVGWFMVSNKKKAVFFPFFFIFILLNLFLFQPYIWDNTKFLVWASLGVSGLAAFVLRRMFLSRSVLVKIVAGLMFFVMIFSGGLDAFYALDKTKHQWGMYSTQDLVMASYIINHTNPNDIFLTSDVHINVIPTLTGRRIIMGFRAWLWTYGMDYANQERDVFAMFRVDANAQDLLKKYNVKYVVFDNAVRTDYKGNEQYYKLRYPVFYQGEGYTIYQIN